MSLASLATSGGDLGRSFVRTGMFDRYAGAPVMHVGSSPGMAVVLVGPGVIRWALRFGVGASARSTVWGLDPFLRVGLFVAARQRRQELTRAGGLPYRIGSLTEEMPSSALARACGHAFLSVPTDRPTSLRLV